MQALAKLELLKAEFSKTAQGGAPDPAPVAAPTGPKAPERTFSPDPRRLVRTGASVIVGFFGFLGLWAALSSIDSAAISYGLVGAEGSRKAVQHLDGGVVAAIKIKEGDLVTSGQELILLDEVQPRAAVEISKSAVDTLTAVIARLEAEASGAEAIAFPKDLVARASDLQVQTLLASQQQLFAARLRAKAAEVNTLVEQIKQSRAQIEIHRGQVAIAEKQHQMVKEELAPKEMLFEKGYATNSPVMQLKRAATGLIGQIEEAKGQIARLEYSITQLQSQIRQINTDFQVKIAQELEESRNKLADAKERQRVSESILERTVIRAPVTGRVLGLAVNTVGGVVERGDKLLEIVPDGGFVIKARFKPADGIEISKGMRAELRILSAEGRKLPMIHGEVRNRSADARPDPQTQELYFDADITVSPEELKGLNGLKLELGTPVEVIVPTGSRTVLQYMMAPVSESLRHGLREK